MMKENRIDDIADAIRIEINSHIVSWVATDLVFIYYLFQHI